MTLSLEISSNCSMASLYQLPVVTVTDHHKLGDLTNIKIYPLTFLETVSLKSVSLGQNQGVGRAGLPLEALGRTH